MPRGHAVWRPASLPVLCLGLWSCIAAATATSTGRALQRALAEAKASTKPSASASVESLWANFTDRSLRWGEKHVSTEAATLDPVWADERCA